MQWCVNWGYVILQRLGGLSYFAGAEKKDERVLVPDLGSLTSVHDRWHKKVPFAMIYSLRVKCYWDVFLIGRESYFITWKVDELITVKIIAKLVGILSLVVFMTKVLVFVFLFSFSE